MKITKVEVFLDDDVPDYMEGVIRCGSVISFDENGNETNHQELIDNTEYYDEKALVKDVAKRLDVEKEKIQILG